MRYILLLFLVILVGCSTISTVKELEDYEMVMKDACGERVALGRQVWCCCDTGQGICCNWTMVCPGYIPGCLCR